jgi:hypothetical protein
MIWGKNLFAYASPWYCLKLCSLTVLSCYCLKLYSLLIIKIFDLHNYFYIYWICNLKYLHTIAEMFHHHYLTKTKWRKQGVVSLYRGFWCLLYLILNFDQDKLVYRFLLVNIKVLVSIRWTKKGREK